MFFLGDGTVELLSISFSLEIGFLQFKQQNHKQHG
jgi:hypothetical protein